jgi:S4 domain protein YaaA
MRLVRTFTLRTEYITLGQLLKAADIIGSGGEARDYLQTQAITVNGEPENRRGRKLRHGDTVELPTQTIRLDAASEAP